MNPSTNYGQYPYQYNQGGPGPSTMQQMQLPGYPQVTPQQMAAFQAMRQQQGQGQMTPQQMQHALGQLQAQAQNGGGQAQALMAAMRDRQMRPAMPQARMQFAPEVRPSPVDSPRQPSYSNMPPPPIPTATPPQHNRFTPNPTQLQAIAMQQQRLMADPGFQAMTPATQQIQLTMIQHRMMSMFAQQQSPIAPSPTPPYSALPPHMARPSSRASQRGSSPQAQSPQSPAPHVATPPPAPPAVAPIPPAPAPPPPAPLPSAPSAAPPSSILPPVDISAFPFDPRLLLQLSHLQDPKWRAETQSRNPNLLSAVHQASLLMQSGKIGKEMMERMQLALAQMRAAAKMEPILQAARSVPVKEWEEALKTTMPFTGITPLPPDPVEGGVPAPADFDSTFDGALPPVSSAEAANVRRWLDTDLAYLSNFDKRKKSVQSKMMNWAKESDMGTPWWMMRKGEVQERRGPGCKIVWPEEKERDRIRVLAKAGRRREMRFTPKQLKSMANVEDHIIPIRVDLEEGQLRLKDTFMWNCADTVVSPDLFAQSLCDDFGLPPHVFAPKIVASILERVKEYKDQVLPLLPRPERPRGTLEEEVWEDAPMTLDEVMKDFEDGGDDLRILIKVDIMVGTQNLSDTFEWDLGSMVTPEDFANQYTAELGLNGEFATALAHDIHEQILVHKRCLFLVGHTSGFVQDDEVRSSFLPPVSSVLRREDIAMSTFTPIFTTYTEEDVALIEREREKDSKRKRRATRARRGIILPDREPVKTHRTLLNPLGSNGLAAPKVEEAVPTAHGPRRAAAITAQANINLLAQDLPIPERAPPSPAPVAKRGGRGWRGRGGLSRASPGMREGSVHDSPMPSVFQPPTGLKRAFTEEEEGPRKRVAGEEDVKPVIRLSRSKSPEKAPTPKITLTVPRRVVEDSDSSSSDSSDESEEEQKKSPTPKSPTPPPAPPPYLIAQVPPGLDIPAWFLSAEAETKTRYPRDRFIVVPKGKVEPGQPVEWRLRCIDCPGKIYNLGPGESFANYEVHLKNRAHISNREKRESGGG